ncbi:hypothetical protein [Sphingomonas sp. YR710]|uniref:hypothetical protein n=1 Tax=Sphingomonas sp. YR710 TaxID=1882773 RepID=UPI00115F875D|nr:hypothetical protein [Sphingomonas sp. YR710]
MQNNISNADVLFIVYGAIFWSLSIAMITICTITSWIFSKAMHVAGNDPLISQARVFFGWCLFLITRNLAIANLAFYMIANSGPELFTKVIKGNLPDKATEMILLLCVLLAMPTFLVVWNALTEAAGDIYQSFKA